MSGETFTYHPNLQTGRFPSVVGRFVGETVSFAVQFHSCKLEIREEKSTIKVPVFTSLLLRTDTSQALLPHCYGLFRPKQGLCIELKAYGGGCLESKYKRKSPVSPKRQKIRVESPMSTKEEANKAMQTPFLPATPRFLQKMACPSDLDSNTALRLSQEIRDHAKANNVAEIRLNFLENIPQVYIRNSGPIAWTLLETLSTDAIWASKDHAFLRGRIARLACKHFIDMIFEQSEAFYSSDRTKYSNEVRGVMVKVKSKDPDSTATAELELIHALFTAEKRREELQVWTNKAANLFTAYVSPSCPLPSEKFESMQRNIPSFIGLDHELETHLLLDSVYFSLCSSPSPQDNPNAAQAIDFVISLHSQNLGPRSWKSLCYTLACIEWIVLTGKANPALCKNTEFCLGAISAQPDRYVSEQDVQKASNRLVEVITAITSPRLTRA